MISAIQPVSMTLLPPVRRTGELERLALPAPQPATEAASAHISSRPVHAVGDAHAAYQRAQAHQRAVALGDRPDLSSFGTVRPQRLTADGVLTVHAFALSPSLTIEPHGEGTRAYARAQGLGNGSRVTVDLSI